MKWFVKFLKAVVVMAIMGLVVVGLVSLVTSQSGQKVADVAVDAFQWLKGSAATVLAPKDDEAKTPEQIRREAAQITDRKSAEVVYSVASMSASMWPEGEVMRADAPMLQPQGQMFEVDFNHLEEDLRRQLEESDVKKRKEVLEKLSSDPDPNVLARRLKEKGVADPTFGEILKKAPLLLGQDREKILISSLQALDVSERESIIRSLSNSFLKPKLDPETVQKVRVILEKNDKISQDNLVSRTLSSFAYWGKGMQEAGLASGKLLIFSGGFTHEKNPEAEDEVLTWDQAKPIRVDVRRVFWHIYRAVPVVACAQRQEVEYIYRFGYWGDDVSLQTTESVLSPWTRSIDRNAREGTREVIDRYLVVLERGQRSEVLTYVFSPVTVQEKQAFQWKYRIRALGARTVSFMVNGKRFNRAQGEDIVTSDLTSSIQLEVQLGKDAELKQVPMEFVYYRERIPLAKM